MNLRDTELAHIPYIIRGFLRAAAESEEGIFPKEVKEYAKKGLELLNKEIEEVEEKYKNT